MTEPISHFLDTALAVILAVIGWVIKKLSDRLENDEKRLTRIEVELAAQNERDIAVENRMSGVESAVKEMNTKLDRMMEILIKR